jgi:hypothetical protein
VNFVMRDRLFVKSICDERRSFHSLEYSLPLSFDHQEHCFVTSQFRESALFSGGVIIKLSSERRVCFFSMPREFDRTNPTWLALMSPPQRDYVEWSELSAQPSVAGRFPGVAPMGPRVARGWASLAESYRSGMAFFSPSSDFQLEFALSSGHERNHRSFKIP